MTPGDPPRRENAFRLAKRLVSGGISLAKLEVQHARAEMARNFDQIKGGVMLLAFAAVVAIVFLIALVAFGIAVLVAIGLWWVALHPRRPAAARGRAGSRSAASGGSGRRR